MANRKSALLRANVENILNKESDKVNDLMNKNQLDKEIIENNIDNNLLNKENNNINENIDKEKIFNKSKENQIIDKNQNNPNEKSNDNEISQIQNKIIDLNENENQDINSNINKIENCGPPPRRKINYYNFNTSSMNRLKKSNSYNSNYNGELFNKSNQSITNLNKFPLQNKNLYNNEGFKDNKLNDVDIYKNKQILVQKDTKPFLENKIDFKNLNDQELNTLEYEIAVIYDQRSYFQYYWSLLKKKHLILFTFLPANDYNLFSIKISLFLLSFSLYFTINAFFFSDETMHKIHKDNGEYNFLFQIPQILYSTIISAVINALLKRLSLSEKNILDIKRQYDINEAKQTGKKIEKCIMIKFIIFFIVSNILLLFFWYYIACFCAVYANTQIILIKDTLVSFSISMIYPFGLNLIPGLIRIPVLKANNSDKKWLYKLSLFIALI